MLGLLKRYSHFSDEWRRAEQDLNVQNRGQKGCGAVREGETQKHFVGMWGWVAVHAHVHSRTHVFGGLKTLHMLGKHVTIELHPLPSMLMLSAVNL